ncbi:MAG TPA: FadR/GntR family transcriptional regulator, partial [Casimicrobiaceae bacterium]|nr:FadR/GntR family transcriptional regulator [Casimicrobiaceae bacterium]
THVFAPVARRSAAEDVRAQLIALIESGRIKVDSRLPSENELARTFGVSRPVVREALVSLRALGLTKSHNGKGTYVASSRVSTPMLLGRYSPANLNEVRRCLEVPSARLAAQRRTSEDVGRLAEIIAALQDADDPARRNKLDASFHMAIAQATGNPLFVKLVEDLRSILEEHSLAASRVPNRRGGAIAEHRAIYDAIVRRDADGAAEAMATHLNAVDNSFLSLERKPAPSSRRSRKPG